MQAPRLAILAPLKAWGGIEGKIVTLAREFLHQGVVVELLLARGGEVPYPERLPHNVQVIDLGSKSKMDTAIKLARRLRETPPDVLLTAKDHAAKAALLARALSRIQIPVFIKITNTQSEILRRPVKRWTAQLLYPLADGVIAISDGVKQDFLTHFRVASQRVITIYNPTITLDFSTRIRKPVNHSWLEGDGPPVIMGMGRLTLQKDFATLVRGFASLRARQSARLIILGDGPQYGELEKLAQELGVREHVDFTGFISEPLPWLSMANLFVLSSRYEGLGNVLIEALASGTPAIATDCPSGPREILENGRLGELVPVGDPEALAHAMERGLKDPPPLNERMSSLERFQSGKVARRYLKVMGLARDE